MPFFFFTNHFNLNNIHSKKRTKNTKLEKGKKQKIILMEGNYIFSKN